MKKLFLLVAGENKDTQNINKIYKLSFSPFVLTAIIMQYLIKKCDLK